MKKIIFILFFLSLFSSLLYAQKLKNEISAGYGIHSLQEGFHGFGRALQWAFFFNPGDVKLNYSTGPAIISYSQAVNKDISAGFSFSYTKVSSQISYLWTHNDTTRFTTQFYTIMGRMQYTYTIPDNFVQVYSGLAWGASFFNTVNIYQDKTSDTEDGSYFAFHLNILGIRVGQNFGGFMELGLGYNGLINGGVSVKF
jgi:hypothetical protein